MFFKKCFLFTFLICLTTRKVFSCEQFESEGPTSTIFCTNKFSISQISLTFKTENFQTTQILEVAQSNISNIPNFAFTQFRTISKLYLIQNHIRSIEIDAFSGLINLKELHLDLNELIDVPNGVYNSLKSLEILNLANNKIEKVSNMALAGLENLLELNLENNRLRKIEAHFFESQKNLQLLDLSGNPLEQFDGEGLSSLSALILAETHLREFDDDLANIKMEILNLSSSRLAVVDFSKFPKVGKIYLSNNEIVKIVNLDKLDSSYISLDNNKILTIEGEFNDVLVVNLRNNQLEILTNTMFNESALVRSLDFGYNRILTIEKDTFRGLFNLQILHLEYNNISKLDPKLFSDLMDLKYLDLSHNNLQDLQFGTFDNLITLKTLNISDNKLKSLHENGLLAVISLEEILFHNNQISYLDVQTLMKFKGQLKVVSLNNNSWDCEDVAKTYVNFISNHSIDLSGLREEGENFHGISCTSKRENVWEDSEMSKFFNEDFRKSNFFQYFQREYKKSDFFKFLDGFRERRAEKLVVDQTQMRDFNSEKILVFGVVVQIIIAVLLLMIFLKKRRHD